MKWKDSGETIDKEEKYFDEEQYSPWADLKNRKAVLRLGKTPTLLALLALAIVALVVVLLMLLFSGNSDPASRQQISALEERLRQLEERLDKYETIDEKVTRIWEQAKSFEKFKDRFDRSEASISLRMDHLTMSLESLQKQVSAALQARPPASARKPASSATPAAQTAKIQYHEVARGETLFSISKRYDLNVEELLKMNQLKPGSVIQPGQKLIIRNAN